MSTDLHGAVGQGWIGVDLDGTLAFYDGWKGAAHIGDPIPKMLKRLQQWFTEGREVRIMTARVSPNKPDHYECLYAIQHWCMKHLGRLLPVTHEKDQYMVELWDDRVVQVIPNTGERADGKE